MILAVNTNSLQLCLKPVWQITWGKCHALLLYCLQKWEVLRLNCNSLSSTDWLPYLTGTWITVIYLVLNCRAFTPFTPSVCHVYCCISQLVQHVVFPSKMELENTEVWWLAAGCKTMAFQQLAEVLCCKCTVASDWLRTRSSDPLIAFLEHEISSWAGM